MNSKLDEYAIFEHDVVMITINASIKNAPVYDAVRYAWKLKPEKASQAEYVLAVAYGRIVGVFIADEWKEANLENFPEYPEVAKKGRFGFTGRDAPQEIVDLYIDKLISSDYRKNGASNPIKYNYEYNDSKECTIRKVFSNGKQVKIRKNNA